ncbi:hypothetical protein [Mucilaginibacter sp.]
MFYYYQIRRHHHKTEAVPYVTCPVCHTDGYLHMSILQKYRWQLGPIAPSGKYAIAWCEHCGNYIPKVKWTDAMDQAFRKMKQGLKTPLRLYRGLVVYPLVIAAVVGIALLVFKVKDHKQQGNQALVKDAILHPHQGDIFQITHTDGTNTYYTYFKVASTRGDSVYFYPSKVRVTDVKNMKAWDNIPTAGSDYETRPIGFSISAAKESDMFTYATQPVQYGMVWSLYRDGTLYKKY